MSAPTQTPATRPVPPPTKHQMALMIWLAVFPTLVVLHFVFEPALEALPAVVRILAMVTVAVPIVVYGIMPLLQRVRVAIITRGSAR